MKRSMLRQINRTIELVIAIGLVISIGINIGQGNYIKKITKEKDSIVHKSQVEINKMKYALRDFAIVNKVPIEYTEKEKENIDKYCKQFISIAPLIKSIGMSEKGLGSHTFGVKRISLETMNKYPIEDWQLIECITIINDEIDRYCKINNVYSHVKKDNIKYVNNNKRKFMYQLASRYCPENAENWYYNVFRNWKKFEAEEKTIDNK